MIVYVLMSNENFVASKPLLTDLLDYIKQGNSENQVIFIGDIYRLPPVGSKNRLHLVHSILPIKKTERRNGELTEVKRQDKDSYILKTQPVSTNVWNIKGSIFEISCKMLSRSTTALPSIWNSRT